MGAARGSALGRIETQQPVHGPRRAQRDLRRVRGRDLPGHATDLKIADQQGQPKLGQFGGNRIIASRATSFVTGQILAVDGGRLLLDPLETAAV